MRLERPAREKPGLQAAAELRRARARRRTPVRTARPLHSAVQEQHDLSPRPMRQRWRPSAERLLEPRRVRATGGAGFAAAAGAGACGVATGAAFRKSSPRDASISATNSPRTGAVGAAAMTGSVCAAGAIAGLTGCTAGGGVAGWATVPGRKLSPNEVSRSETKSFRTLGCGAGSGTGGAQRQALAWARALRLECEPQAPAWPAPALRQPLESLRRREARARRLGAQPPRAQPLPLQRQFLVQRLLV